MKGRHCPACIEETPDCPCIRCAKDNDRHPGEWPCCLIHRLQCVKVECKDFEEETDE